MKLEIITDGLNKLLKDNNYSKKSITRYCRLWNNLRAFLLDQYKDTDFTLKKGMFFLEKQYGIISGYNKDNLTHNQIHMIRAINLLEDYRLHGVLIKRYNSQRYPIKLNNYYSCKLKEFSDDINSKYLSNTTKKRYIREVEFIMDFMMQKKVNNLSDINLQICNDYILTFVELSIRTVGNRINILKYFLRYLEEQGLISENIASKILIPRTFKNQKIPQGWTADEIKEILGAVDTNNPMGKRDYAMILLASVLGLRIGDIKRLTFNNFDWRNKKLNLIQHKTNKPLTLDIPSRVGWAVIDYIKNGRPKAADTQTVFIRHVAPYDPFSEESRLTNILAKYIRKAGLSVAEGHHKGFHSLRHSAASLMLEDGTELTTISEVLGHSDVNITSVYLKTDIKKLSECILPLHFEDDGEEGLIDGKERI